MNQLHRDLCREVFERLDDYLDGELAAEERLWVETHLEECSECAREARFEADLLHGIRSKLRGPQPPTDLARRVFARLQAAMSEGASPEEGSL